MGSSFYPTFKILFLGIICDFHPLQSSSLCLISCQFIKGMSGLHYSRLIKGIHRLSLKANFKKGRLEGAIKVPPGCYVYCTHIVHMWCPQKGVETHSHHYSCYIGSFDHMPQKTLPQHKRHNFKYYYYNWNKVLEVVESDMLDWKDHLIIAHKHSKLRSCEYFVVVH